MMAQRSEACDLRPATCDLRPATCDRFFTLLRHDFKGYDLQTSKLVTDLHRLGTRSVDLQDLRLSTSAVPDHDNRTAGQGVSHF